MKCDPDVWATSCYRGTSCDTDCLSVSECYKSVTARQIELVFGNIRPFLYYCKTLTDPPYMTTVQCQKVIGQGHQVT